MKTEKKDITDKQMSSIHVAYRLWAKALNDAGYSVNKAIEQKLFRLDVPFTENNVKEMFGYAVIEALYPDKFTGSGPKHPRLSTTETQLLFESINAALAQRFGVSIPFPCKEQE